MISEDMEKYKEYLKEEIDKGKRLKSLLDNKDFKEFILDGYTKDYVLYNLKNSTDTKNPLEVREDYLLKAKGASIFTHYLDGLLVRAEQAKSQLNEIDDVPVFKFSLDGWIKCQKLKYGESLPVCRIGEKLKQSEKQKTKRK